MFLKEFILKGGNMLSRSLRLYSNLFRFRCKSRIEPHLRLWRKRYAWGVEFFSASMPGFFLWWFWERLRLFWHGYIIRAETKVLYPVPWTYNRSGFGIIVGIEPNDYTVMVRYVGEGAHSHHPEDLQPLFAISPNTNIPLLRYYAQYRMKGNYAEFFTSRQRRQKVHTDISLTVS